MTEDRRLKTDSKAFLARIRHLSSVVRRDQLVARMERQRNPGTGLPGLRCAPSGLHFLHFPTRSYARFPSRISEKCPSGGIGRRSIR